MNAPTNSFAGYNVIESHAMVRQFRFPRTKKRRIRNKWSARMENWKPRTDFMMHHVRRFIICHPSAAARLRDALARPLPDRVDAMRYAITASL